MLNEEMYNSDHVFTKEELIGYLEIMKPPGYILNTNDLYYVKNESGKRTEVSFSIDEHYPFYANFGGISVSVRFEEVEDIMYSIFKDYHNAQYRADPEATTFEKSFRESIIGDEGLRFLQHNHVWNQTSFYTLKPYLDRMMQAGLQFLDKYRTLEDFYNLFEPMPIAEQSDFYNQPFPHRRMIVKKILGAADYESYSSQIVTGLNQTYPGQDIAAFATALKAHLDTL